MKKTNKNEEDKFYILFNKPKGVVTTTSPLERPNLLDYINTRAKFGYAGRLDKDAEGLLLITNDGNLINKITHPRFGVHKVYEVKLNKPFKSFKELDEEIIKLRKIDIKIKPLNKSKTRWLVRIHEGRKHIIKWVFRKLGYKVTQLKRLRIGSLTLNGLKPGKFKFIKKEEAYKAGENEEVKKRKQKQ